MLIKLYFDTTSMRIELLISVFKFLILLSRCSNGFINRKSRFIFTSLKIFREDNKDIDLESFQRKQFENFSKNQVGKWIGVHTGYDPEDEMVADHM